MSETVQELQARKATLCVYRDSLADLYNEYIQKLVEHENDPEEFERYRQLIEDLEPKTRETKEQMREINRLISLSGENPA